MLIIYSCSFEEFCNVLNQTIFNMNIIGGEFKLK